MSSRLSSLSVFLFPFGYWAISVMSLYICVVPLLLPYKLDLLTLVKFFYLVYIGVCVWTYMMQNEEPANVQDAIF